MKGLTTVFDHKKWMFAYIVLALMTYLLVHDHLDGAQYMMGLLALIPVTIGASSFDKSVWRKDNAEA